MSAGIPLEIMLGDWSTMTPAQVLKLVKKQRASQLAAFADQVYAASEPVKLVPDSCNRCERLRHRCICNDHVYEPVHVPGELDHLDEPQGRDGGPDTWTDAERNL